MQTLGALEDGGDLLAHVRTRRSVDGTLAARVLPAGTYERLLFHGVSAEVWMQDGVTEQNLRQNMAGFYQQANPRGRLGARARRRERLGHRPAGHPGPHD